MELWYTEKQTPNVGITCKTTRSLVTEKTEFQDLAIIDTEQFGRMLVLDGMVQTTVADEFVYHEMITHVPLNTHPDPQKVLVIGGGDGGTIREVIKHPRVQKAVLVEIDRRVVELSKEYLPEISCGLNDPKVEVIIDDGIKHVADNPDTYDIILVDSTEPVGPAVQLFSADFYRSIFRALKADGLFVAQTESPFYNDDLIRQVYRSIAGIFPVTRLYLASVPTYPSGLWSFTMGSKKHDPEQVAAESIPAYPTRYYNAGVHQGCFKLPQFVAGLLK
ncbi:MAG: polyamine aminopropyltransferase [Bacillota bacterium]